MGVSTMAVGDSMNVLFIPYVAPSNRGNYTCVAKNTAGHDLYTAQLLVNGIHYTQFWLHNYFIFSSATNSSQSVVFLLSHSQITINKFHIIIIRMKVGSIFISILMNTE